MTQLESKISPMMEQWLQCKKTAKDAILLFRLGDFYEAFHEDAILIAKELDLTLTQRVGTPMSGVPWHTSESYIDRLVAKGFRVAIAEQIEDPKEVKGIVKREVVKIVSPGTHVTSHFISERSNNYIVSICQLGSLYGLAVLDLSTGEFKVTEFETVQDLFNEIYRLHPSECVISEKFKDKHPNFLKELEISLKPLMTYLEDWFFDHQSCYGFLIDHFKVLQLDGFGLKGMICAINAAGALLAYLKEQLCLPIEHVQSINPYSIADSLGMDKICQRNLELVESLQDGSKKNTLLEVIDKTSTPMGARLLIQWLKHPLIDVAKIQKRQDGVELLLNHPPLCRILSEVLPLVRDLERLNMKISAGYANPRDILALRISLEQLPAIKKCLSVFETDLIQESLQQLQELPQLVAFLTNALVEEPPLRLSDGNIFRDHFHPTLDELRNICRNGKQWIVEYQMRLKEETGIKTLKVSFNKIFGYYIEVSKGQAERMPAIFQRRQTLVNSERFITPELKEYEDKVLNAEDRLVSLEQELFQKLRLEIAQYAKQINESAQAIAQLDCLLSLAEVAQVNGYIRPHIDESHTLFIEEGRHPIVENVISKEKFISNDTYLDDQKQRLMLITGPNMAGKSTYIRQVALIVIMAQMGSFVPAKSAHIGIVDKIFTRIGASDDLSRGQSTFMVEMTETANILNNATSRSLVILDEIGRGTSTYDGISIAWAVVEYLLLQDQKMAKTLFATHYWELTKIPDLIEGAVNYNVRVQENNEGIIFMHEIVQGTSDRSYGIHVGRLAGLPPIVLNRAQEILSQLEKNDYNKDRSKRIKSPKETQLLLF